MIKKAFFLLLTGGVLEAKGAVDYNRTPLNKSGSITITPQTPAAIIKSYTQPLNQDGRLDKTFNGTGKVTTAIGNGTDGATACVLQPDGKIVAVGYANNGANTDFALVRYNSNGSLDTSFGPDGTGKVTTAVGNGSDGANACVLQPDGKIVAVGYSNNGGVPDFALVRYNSNGSIDTSFGPNGTGKVTTAVGNVNDGANACVLQPDGKIVAVGYANTGANTDFALVRYNSNGSLDTSFGPNGTGKVTTAIGNGNDIAYACVLQPDGKMVAVGYSSNGANFDFALACYNSNGSLDTSFGPDGTGKVTTAIGNGNDIPYACVLQSDGKIVAVGYSSNGVNTDFALVRYNSNGSLDTSFGSDGTGKVTTVIGNGNDEANACVLQPDGKIIAVGYGNTGANTDFALVRYNSNGSLDTSFGPDGTGKVTTAVGNGTDEANASLLQPDGKIIAVGLSRENADDNFALVRYFNPFSYTSFTASYGSVGLL